MEIMTPEPLFQNAIILRKPRAANLLASSKLQQCPLIQPLETQTKLKEIEILY